MSSAKEDILARIRTSLADAPVAPEPQRNYRRVSHLNQEQTIEMLVDRLIDYKANVFEATEANIADVIAERLGETSHYVVPVGLNRQWLPEDTPTRTCFTDSGSTLEPGALTVHQLDAVDAVVTSSTVSCAETGTIFLNSNQDEGRRAISLVPDHHICVVPRSRPVSPQGTLIKCLSSLCTVRVQGDDSYAYLYYANGYRQTVFALCRDS